MTVGMPAQRVSDEVWAQLAGESALEEREARVVRRSALGIAAALLVVVGVWALGLFAPHLDHGNSSGATMDPRARTAQYDFDLINAGLWPENVQAVSVDVPGVVVTSMTPASLPLPRDSSRHLLITLNVQDCSAAQRAIGTDDAAAAPPLRIIVSRPWGTVTSSVRPPDDSWLNHMVLYACGQEPAQR
jgi:hypothetical protein